MSAPSVWNGRNERILGPSTDSNASISTLPTSNVEQPDKAPKEKNGSSGKASSAPAAAAPPSRSVWNGKHDKIMEISDANPSRSSSAAPTHTPIAGIPPTSSTKTKSSVTLTKKKKGAFNNNSLNNSGNSKNNHNSKVVLPSTLSKVVPVVADEGTNSTAGSSTTNTIIEEESLPSDANRGSTRSVDGSDNAAHHVVVNVVQDVAASPSNTSSLETEGQEPEDKKGASRSGEDEQEKTQTSRSDANVVAEAALSSSSPAPPVLSVGEKKKKKSDTPTSAASTSVGGNSSKSNAKKVGRNNNNANYNHNGSSQNNGHRGGNHKQNGSNNSGRGSSGHGNGRRKANSTASIPNLDKPVCAFFVRGMCNRGASCQFKHDPAFAPSTPGATATTAPSSSLSNKGNPINKLLRHGGKGNTVSSGSAVSTNSPPYSRAGSGRVFDPLKARAIQMAKDAQDKEDRSIFASPSSSLLHKDQVSEPAAYVDPPFFSIDVECIATGYGSCAKGINDGCGNEGRNGEGIPASQYNDLSHRYPGRVAMVDSDGNLLTDIIIRPPQNGKGVVSYLTELTGLTEEMCLGPEAKSLEEAVAMIKSLLPKDGVLVGQAIDHDVEWLGLVPGRDFQRFVDVSVIFRQRIPAVLAVASEAVKNAVESGSTVGSKDADPSSDEYLGFDTRYRSFSLRHVCLNLLGTDIQSGVHDPIIDARYSLILFHKYRNSSVTQLRIVRDGLHRAPVTPGFAAEKTPVLDGVCVSVAGYPYKRAGRKIWRWYVARKGQRPS